VIEVETGDLGALRGERDGDVDRRRRLAGAALFIGEDDDMRPCGHGFFPKSILPGCPVAALFIEAARSLFEGVNGADSSRPGRLARRGRRIPRRRGDHRAGADDGRAARGPYGADRGGAAPGHEGDRIEDLARYPRREAADARLLADHGCDLLWAPPVEVMYPEGFATNVSVTGVSDGLDGAARPGHFDGVATVVTKLFNQTRADIAYFGEKDFQQLAVIRRFVVDLDMAIEIVGVPTQRDDDGLALSSRNIYLDEEQRAKAIALPRALGVAARGIARGDDPEGALAEARGALVAAGFEVDYVALADAETLAESPAADRPRRLLAAARMGTTRLIDNVAVEATP
jgi:pantoate--beta-alanine ligase